MPLFHRCLNQGVNQDIAKFLNSRMNASEKSEKDKVRISQLVIELSSLL